MKPFARGYARPARWIAVVLLMMLLSVQPAAAATNPTTGGQTPLRIVFTENLSPFSERETNGDLTGFNVDLARAMCRVMKVDCVFTAEPLKALIDDVAAGRFDIGFGNLLRTPEREKRLLFSEPYWRSSSSLIGRRGTPDISLAEAVRTLRIATIKGSRQNDVLARLAGADHTLITVPTTEELWVSLREGKCDLAIAPTLNAMHFLLSDGGEGFETVGNPMTDNGLGGAVHIVFPPGRGDLKTAVDHAVEALRSDSTYQSLNHRYFPFDIY